MPDSSTQEYRGVGIRFVAQVIDLVVLVVVGYLLATVTGSTTGSGFSLEGGLAFLWFAISVGYFVVLEGTSGQTVGKRLTGIVVLTESGEPIDVRDSLVRNLLRFVDGFFFYAVGAILIYLSDREQRFGDRVADTVVVSAGSEIPADAEDSDPAVGEDATATDEARPS